MRRGSSSDVALPLLVASSGCSSWADVLSCYRKTCELLRGVYQPTTEELRHGLAKMETSWSTSLFYYEVIKGTCGYKQPPTRLVSTALERFKRCGNFYAMKRIMQEDVDTTTNEGARSMLVYASFTGMWEHAMALYEGNERMQHNLADTRTLVNILAPHGHWDKALQLLYSRSPAPLNSMFIKPIIRSLGSAGEYNKMLRLVAASLAQGHGMDENLFSALVRPLQKRGHWRAVLETAEDLGILSSSRESTAKNIAMYGGLCDCLYSANPYSTFTLREIVDDITHRMHPRKNFEFAQRNGKTFRLLSSSELFRIHRRYLNPLSSIYVKLLSLNKVHFRPVSELADDALKHGDTLLVLDTNFLLQCTAKNLPLNHFYLPMLKQYPQLEGKPLEHVILPFTTVREIYQLIWNPSTQLKRAVRSLLWSRVVTFLKQPTVTVLALSSEFPCISFSILSHLAYLRLNEPANESDPDLRILNTCLSLQYTLRLRKAGSLQGASLISEGTMLFSFLKYHIRRHHREVRGITSESLLLCTLDKRLSAAADELGVQTFPRFHMSEDAASETIKKKRDV
ncbi:hypothetical protein TraAM80_04770 [Trypanosoma rangeli]|uniref:PIN domain-containing protein n=1 Tax=Trypanosoma rangeli TaxID=5698 RepID=A0A422NHU1_TRYRA|nr:uncharacterized protein TraAM80_04770 [Trypanosoma rangeli]RNF05050.1 hypothetical protein TraAM80_04770 [Trypanosoma rangeli]|eukprot:RNF05050.1 hypothetical protein TraAM80_04770 [Trypanosoma rangeli]